MEKVVIAVYGKDNCPACRQTKMFLDSKEVPYLYYKVIDEQGNPVDAAMASELKYFKEQGFKQFPVVSVTYPDGVDEWSGFRPDKLKQIVYKGVDNQD